MDAAAGGFGGPRPSIGCSQDPLRAGGHIVPVSPQPGLDHPHQCRSQLRWAGACRTRGWELPPTAVLRGAGCCAGRAHGTGDPRRWAGRTGAAGLWEGSAPLVLAGRRGPYSPLQRSRVSAPSPWQVGEWDREAGPRSGEQGSQGHRSLVPCSGSTALPAEPPAPTGVPGLPSPARGQHRIKKT